MIFHKYQGAGNDFLIADNRDGSISLSAAEIAQLCDRRYGIGADGLMLLENGPEGYDFRMVYYNSDGSGGMMCGNGGRCIVAFAHRCGLRSYRFIAADGPHYAEILEQNGNAMTVKLGMKNVDEIIGYDQPGLHGWFLDTGTRHFVCPVTDLANFDVVGEGRRIRYMQEFGPVGVNVNFIERAGDTLKVRTYEKGVEDETYACGTGITASAIADWHRSPADRAVTHVPVRALRDDLAVEFTPTATGAAGVYLIGPATYVATVTIPEG